MAKCYWCDQEVANGLDCPCTEWIKKNFPDTSNVIQTIIRELSK